MNWEKIDKAMVASRLNDPDELEWFDPADAPFRVSGLNWFGKERVYMRFPKDSLAMLSDAAPGVAALCRHTTGGQLAFQTDARRVVIAAKLTGVNSMDHFAATGVCGMDLYAAYPGEPYRFESVTRFPITADEYACQLLTDDQARLKRVIVHLPLYMGVEDVKIGLPIGARVCAPEPFEREQPIVLYGTSITQGGCASRPGMLYTNILSRRMNRPFLNFGFSGSGKGEPEVVRLIAQVSSPALYVLAYEANACDGLYDTLSPMLDILRAAHPDTPILLCSRLYVQQEAHDAAARARRDALRAFQRDTVQARASAGDRHLFFADGSTFLGDHADECFVDGAHPTDLGFWRIADALEPILRGLIQ